MNSYEILIHNMTDDTAMIDVQHALAAADIGDAGNAGMYLRDGKPRSIFVYPSEVGKAVEILNGLGYETDEDEMSDDDDAVLGETTLAKLRAAADLSDIFTEDDTPRRDVSWNINPYGVEKEIVLSTGSGGSPIGEEKIKWVSSDSTKAYSTVRNGAAYSWVGKVIATELPCDKKDTDTFAGIIRWRKFSHQDGTMFYFGYGQGSPYNFDHAEIRLAL